MLYIILIIWLCEYQQPSFPSVIVSEEKEPSGVSDAVPLPASERPCFPLTSFQRPSFPGRRAAEMPRPPVSPPGNTPLGAQNCPPRHRKAVPVLRSGPRAQVCPPACLPGHRPTGAPRPGLRGSHWSHTCRGQTEVTRCV